MKRLFTLTDQQRAAITRRYKHEKNPRFRERLHCLLLKDRGHTNTAVAELLLVTPDTITEWLNLYEDGRLETLCRLETGGSDGFLTIEQIATLSAELDKHVFQTTKKCVRGWPRALPCPTRNGTCAICSDAWAKPVRKPIWIPSKPTWRHRRLLKEI